MSARAYGFAAWLLVLTVCALSNDSAYAAPSDSGKLTLRIIHTNDMHSRFEETSQLSGICNKQDAEAGKCYGGFARITTLVREARANSNEDEPVIFLNAGDTYQGNTLFSYYKWKIVTKFLNILKPDVASLGNHEFDDGVSGLVPYLNNATFPIVAANLDLTNEPRMQQAKQLKKSTILLVKNKKIGVIGYLTPETTYLSRVDEVKILDEVPAIQDEAKKLKSQGCDIIIALGHSGYEMDKKIGREVEEIDLVVGGHTNTFLYNGVQPDEEKPEGLYPTVVVQPSGRKVYVVQAYAYTKYLGDIRVEFDGRGEITRIEGKPILVDSSVPKAMDVEEELKKWTEPLDHISMTVVGTTKVLLEGGEKVCRLQECNFGNFLTDAMIYYNTEKNEVDNGWTDTAIALHQAGGIRSSISTINDFKVTMEDLLMAFPFGTKVFKVSLDAKTLWKVLEWGVHDRLSQTTVSHGGGFLQFSGLQVTYDISKPLYSRVVSVKVRCNACQVPSYMDINMDATYKVLITDFMHSGGDGFDMLKNLPYKNLNVTVANVVAHYINQTSPVYPGVEGRIKFVLTGTHDPLQINASSKDAAAPNAAVNFNIYQISTMAVLLSCFALIRSI